MDVQTRSPVQPSQPGGFSTHGSIRGIGRPTRQGYLTNRSYMQVGSGPETLHLKQTLELAECDMRVSHDREATPCSAVHQR
jgi:hypothetical protein